MTRLTYIWLAVAVIWTLVLILPRPRGLLHAAIYPWPPTAVFDPAIGFWGPPPDDPGREPEASRYSRLTSRTSSDKNLSLSATLALPLEEQRVALEKLANSYPSDLTMLAAYLKSRAENEEDWADRGPFNNPNVSGPPPPPHQLSAAEKSNLAKLIAAARRGQALQPRNSFFDWYLMTGLLQLGREKQAIDVLFAAASKPDYHDFFPEEMLSMLQARRLERELSPQDVMTVKNHLIWLTGLRAYRMDTRHMMDIVVEARSRGRKREALHIAAAMTRLERRAQREGSTKIAASVALACEFMSIRYCSTTTRLARGPANITLSNPSSLPGFATSLHEPALALDALSEYRRLSTVRSKVRPLKEWFPMSKTTLAVDILFSRCVAWFLTGAEVLLPLWFVLILAIRQWRPLPPRSNDVAFSVAAGFMVLPLLLVLEAAAIQAKTGFSEYLFCPDERWLNTNAFPLIAYLPLFALVFAAAARTNIALRAQVSRPDAHQFASQWGTDPSFALNLLLRIIPLVFRLSLWILCLACLISPSIAVYRQSEQFALYQAAAFFILPLLTLWQVALWLRLNARRDSGLSAISILEASINRYLAWGLLVIGLGLLILAPAAAAFERDYESLIRQGEWPVMQAKFGL